MMSKEEQYADLLAAVREHADHLNSIRKPKLWGKVFYDAMSGGLVWEDETRSDTPWLVINALRIVSAYRTSLMLGEPREEFEGVWNECRKLFPDWVGFREGRRTPTPKLMRIYREGSVSLKKCLRDMEREIEKEEQEKLMYYVATAYRRAKRAGHSYVIGVYSTLEKAEAAAAQHIHDRGFKYGYGIDACPLDEELEDDDENIVNPHGG